MCLDVKRVSLPGGARRTLGAARMRAIRVLKGLPMPPLAAARVRFDASRRGRMLRSVDTTGGRSSTRWHTKGGGDVSGFSINTATTKRVVRCAYTAYLVDG